MLRTASSRNIRRALPNPALQPAPTRTSPPTPRWFWGSKLFDNPAALPGSAEMEKIAVASMIEYPVFAVRPPPSHRQATRRRAYRRRRGVDLAHLFHHSDLRRNCCRRWAARQQRGEISFAAIHARRIPGVAVDRCCRCCWRGGQMPPISPNWPLGERHFCGNAFICGALSAARPLWRPRGLARDLRRRPRRAPRPINAMRHPRYIAGEDLN